MNLGNAIKMAFKSLRASKMRTFLTMLGVIIGVFTVAILTTVTDGATSAVIGNLKRESTMSMILVQKETSVKFFDDVISQVKTDEKIGEFDYSVLVTKEANINSASKVVSIMTGKDEFGNPAPSQYYKRPVSIKTSVYAVRNNYDKIRNLKLDGEWVQQANEVVVDRELVDNFFGESSPNAEVIGKTIKLGGENLISIKVNTTSSISGDDIYGAIKFAVINYLAINIENMNKMVSGTATAEELIQINADVDSALSGIYKNEENNVYEVRIAPNAFIGDSQFISLLKLGLTQAGITDNEVLNSITITDIFDSTLEREYTIVGVITEDNSAFSTNSSGDMKTTLSTMGTEFAALTEAMERSSKGRAYMLIDNANLPVLDATQTNSDNLSIYGAYLRFKDENKVGDSNIRIMIAFMQKGYKIMSDILPVSMDSVAAIVNTSMNVLTVMLTVISSISLIVGGIGIMNIMLVAVTERTREIGIRKAIGAKRSSILTQFLIEALVVSLLGGLIGLLLSFIASLIIGAIMGISLAMPLWVIAMSLGFCLVIGVVFGMYPAIKASKLQPIDALRHD